MTSKEIIRDCWSRDFSYEEYVNYCDRLDQTPTTEELYNELCSLYEREMRLYFLNTRQ